MELITRSAASRLAEPPHAIVLTKPLPVDSSDDPSSTLDI